MGNENFFKKRSTVFGFAAFSLIAGFIFLNSGMTGNVVLNQGVSPSPISLIGLVLVFCSVVLALYASKKR